MDGEGAGKGAFALFDNAAIPLCGPVGKVGERAGLVVAGRAIVAGASAKVRRNRAAEAALELDVIGAVRLALCGETAAATAQTLWRGLTTVLGLGGLLVVGVGSGVATLAASVEGSTALVALVKGKDSHGVLCGPAKELASLLQCVISVALLDLETLCGEFLFCFFFFLTVKKRKPKAKRRRRRRRR